MGKFTYDRKKQKNSGGQDEPALQYNQLDCGNGAPALFLLKTYSMLATCDERLAAWADNGETFVVKDPDEFAAHVIPKYFEHSNFSSFARQLNFYGFKKVHMKPIRMDMSHEGGPKQVKFHNPNFKQGRKDLLSNIFRSTRKSGANNGNIKREIEALKTKVAYLETQLAEMDASVAVMRHTMKEMGKMQSYGQKTPNVVTSTDKSATSWSESNKAAATLTPSPHVKEIDPALLPAPPAPHIRSTSFLRGLSNATLTPSPHVKEIDPALLPAPPAPHIRSTSFLRGLSNEFERSGSHILSTLLADSLA